MIWRYKSNWKFVIAYDIFHEGCYHKLLKSFRFQCGVQYLYKYKNILL